MERTPQVRQVEHIQNVAWSLYAGLSAAGQGVLHCGCSRTPGISRLGRWQLLLQWDREFAEAEPGMERLSLFVSANSREPSNKCKC